MIGAFKMLFHSRLVSNTEETDLQIEIKTFQIFSALQLSISFHTRSSRRRKKRRLFFVKK